MIKIKRIISLPFLFLTLSIFSQEVFDVNVSKTTKIIPPNPTGIVSCWLMDSDENRPRNMSNADAFKEMGVGMIRFPYGHLSNNYLWTVPPYEDAVNGLKPKVGSLHEDPGLWDWAVDQVIGEFKKSMDFDEFINTCNEVEAEPFVCVNVMSYKYQEGPTYEELKQSAVEWVKYANIIKNYNVKFWMLGNEQDLHESLLSKSEYISLYNDFAVAMKEVDSTIILSPAVLYQKDWFVDVLENCHQYIDVISTQQYLWGASWTSGGYNTWKEFEGVHSPLIETLLSALDESPKPNLDIYITETGATPPSGWPDGTQNDLYRSLCWFDQCMGQLMTEKVKGNLYWCSHSPWQGEHGDGDLRNALTNDSLNRRKPTGEIIKIVNNNINTEFVETNRISGYVRNYTMYSPTDNELTVFLLNKNNQQVQTKIYLHNSITTSSFSRWVYSGTSPYDTLPSFKQSGSISLTDSGFTSTLDSVSLTVIKLQDVSRKEEPAPPIGKYIWLKSYITGKFITATGNSLHATSDTISGTDQMFFVEDAGNGYIRLKTLAGQGGYIQAQLNSDNYLETDGTANDSDLWKWKHVYENGNKHVLLESKIHPGLHARVNNDDTEKRIDALGGTGSWAWFNFGLALSDKKSILATSYGILDTLNKQIAIPESLLISDFIEGLIISEKASLKIMKISGLDTIAVNASENIMLDSDMEIWVTAEDSSIRSYDLVFPESTSNGGLNDEHEWDIVLLQKNGFVEINSSQPISHVKIYNLQGKVLIQEKFDSQGVEIDVTALNNGVYLVEVMTVRGKKTIRKFIY